MSFTTFHELSVISPIADEWNSSIFLLKSHGSQQNKLIRYFEQTTEGKILKSEKTSTTLSWQIK